VWGGARIRLHRIRFQAGALCLALFPLSGLAQINVTIAPPDPQRPSAQDAAPARADTHSGLPTGAFNVVFKGGGLAPKHRNPNISYALDPNREQFFVYVPTNYTGSTPFGLVVFTDPGDNVEGVPAGWIGVLESRKLLFVAAHNAGNREVYARRMGLAVLGALEMMRHYRIDPARVYASGFSGGARIAGRLGFFQSDVFHGTIQNSGADFYRPVAKVYATSSTDTAGLPYGIFHASAAEVEAARRVRFVLITGSNDFRRGNILDVYYGGFAKSAIQSKLFDVPGLGHDTCDGETFLAALDFIEGTGIPVSTRP